MLKKYFIIYTSVSVLLAQTPNQTVGLFLNSPASSPGYTLFAPMNYTETYLINNDGNLVHSWSSDFRPGLSAYLTENGQLFRTRKIDGGFFETGGGGGGVELLNWDGSIAWEYQYANQEHWQHHDIELLPNGNILMIAWEHKSFNEAVAEGRDPSLLGTGGEPWGLWPDHIIEVETATDSIVWSWHVWDHLIQDHDSTKNNFGVVSDHPERININFPDHGQLNTGGDWIHSNSIDYNEELDQILISARHFGEVWIIDHSTTTVEAATDSGGNSGKGGRLLYRWGNPNSYQIGQNNQRFFYGQHDARWINDGNQIMVFNNGVARPAGSYSSVDVFTPTLNENNIYDLDSSGIFGPDFLDWQYTDTIPTDFFSVIVSGAHELENGNVLITDGSHGRYFEVDSIGNTVWTYINPVIHNGPLYQGQEVPAIGGPTTLLLANQTFRVHRYSPEYPGLAGHNLVSLGPVELYMPAPPELLEPENEIQLILTEENVETDSITFSWTSSSDLNGDSLYYELIIANANLINESYSTDLTEISLMYSDFLNILSAGNVSSANFIWDIRVSDGLADVTSSNGPFHIYVDAEDILQINNTNVPSQYTLGDNFPNPFNPQTSIPFFLPKPGLVEIAVYDLKGNRVIRLINMHMEPGNYKVKWDGLNDQGIAVSSGIYFYVMNSASDNVRKKMILLR